MLWAPGGILGQFCILWGIWGSPGGDEGCVMGLFQTLACGKSGQARGVTYKMEAASAGHSSSCPPFALPPFPSSCTFCCFHFSLDFKPYKMEATSAGHSSSCPPFALPALAFLFSRTFCFSSCFTRFHIGTPHLIQTASSKERLQKVFCKVDFVWSVIDPSLGLRCVPIMVR